MLHLKITGPASAVSEAVHVLDADPAVSNLVHLPGASVRPAGDLVLADVAREAANEVLDQLRALGLHRSGSIHVEPVRTWLSQAGLEAEQRTPGSSADSVVWADVTQRAYEESELNWTYLSFMTLATLIATIAIVLDSQILVIGAMVLGPEFIAIAALGLALVRRRFSLFAVAARALVVGFLVAIAVTALAALAARGLGWITIDDVTGPRPGTGQMVVHRGGDRRGRRCPLADVGEGGRALRCLHLGDDDPGRRQRVARTRLRGAPRDLGQLAAARPQPVGHGAGRVADLGVAAGGLVTDVGPPGAPGRATAPAPAGGGRRG